MNGKQASDNADVTAPGCLVERSRPTGVARVDVDFVGQQRGNRPFLTLPGGGVQRRVFLALWQSSTAKGEQQMDNFDMTTPRSSVKRSLV